MQICGPPARFRSGSSEGGLNWCLTSIQGIQSLVKDSSGTVGTVSLSPGGV